MDLKITNESKHISKVSDIPERYTPDQKVKVAKASRDFESLLTSMMFKSMTKNTNGMMGEDGYGGDVFESMFENELSSFATKKNSLGIAKELYKKITGEDLPVEESMKLSEKLGNSAPVKKETKAPVKTPVDIRTDNTQPAVSPSTSSINRLNKYEGIISNASKEYGIDSNIIKSVILAESAGNEKAQSVSKAKGLMQLMDSTARSMGVKNVWDPKENIQGGTKYLADLLRQYKGDLKLALAAYNAGPGNVEKYKGVPPFQETKTYITRVMGYLNHLNG
ncbi:MAG: transglycosylase SLT domain-containing protein [Ignavibacteria bacterium]